MEKGKSIKTVERFFGHFSVFVTSFELNDIRRDVSCALSFFQKRIWALRASLAQSLKVHAATARRSHAKRATKYLLPSHFFELFCTPALFKCQFHELRALLPWQCTIVLSQHCTAVLLSKVIVGIYPAKKLNSSKLVIAGTSSMLYFHSNVLVVGGGAVAPVSMRNNSIIFWSWPTSVCFRTSTW